MKLERKSIELELRAEIEPSSFSAVLDELGRSGKAISRRKRLSAMFLGKISGQPFDIRVRIDDSHKAEIVFKRGAFHSHKRIEHSEGIFKKQFLGIIKNFSLFGFKSKVTERENFNFLLPKGIFATLVRAGKICYVEFEKKSDKASLKRNRRAILVNMEEFNLVPIGEFQFKDLCGRLSRLSDWKLTGSARDFKRLRVLLRKY